MKLQEGNVFNHVSVILFIGRGILYRAHPTSVHGSGFPDMFKLVQLGPDCTLSPGTFNFVHYEARSVGKRVVGIRLKRLLVKYCEYLWKGKTTLYSCVHNLLTVHVFGHLLCEEVLHDNWGQGSVLTNGESFPEEEE